MKNSAPPATPTPTPMPALSPVVRPLLLLVKEEEEAEAGVDVVEEMPRDTGMFWAESSKQQAVLLWPQHHFVTVSLMPQGVTSAVPSAEASCCSPRVVSEDTRVGAGAGFFGCCTGVSAVCYWGCMRVLLKDRCITGLEVFMTYPVARANI
jgi:hypothetical protein